jgi:hypothetical protein
LVCRSLSRCFSESWAADVAPACMLWTGICSGCCEAVWAGCVSGV